MRYVTRIACISKTRELVALRVAGCGARIGGHPGTCTLAHPARKSIGKEEVDNPETVIWMDTVNGERKWEIAEGRWRCKR
jgi:hypothetical protein